MICVYKASGPTDATLVLHWLQRNGIPAVVRGDLIGLRGQIPLSDAWPTVWVPEPAREDALRALRAYEAPRLVHPRWACARCGEDNEPNFGSCWNCEAER